MKPFLFLLAVAAAAIITVTALGVFPGIITAQGPLTPPAAPGPTMKTLDQIEPRKPISTLPLTISTSGSYYLTGNLTATADGAAITVSADNVAIDLNGFTLSGGGAGSRTCIYVPPGHKGLTLRNGTFSDWTQGAVSADAITSGIYENLRLISNGAVGLATGDGALVRGCVVAFSSGATGIQTGSAAMVSDCTITGSFAGISAGERSTIVNSTASGNVHVGIFAANNCTISNCTASNNGGGIQTGNACTISGCTVNANSGNGIYVGGSYSTISGCTVSQNEFSGVLLFDNCFVSGCTIAANNTDNTSSAAGIFVRGDGCRIDGNYFANNNYAGLVAETGVTKTFIVRNIFRGAQYILRTFPGGHVYGPFEDHTSSGGQIATTSPWANIGD